MMKQHMIGLFVDRLLGESGSFEYVDKFVGVSNEPVIEPHGIAIDSNDKIYIVGENNEGSSFGKKGILRFGKRTFNAASLGPKMLASSFGYSKLVDSSGSRTEAWKLNNISEFPHSQGIYQMPNLLLGTKTKGSIGKSIEDSLIAVTHHGSVVHVMWPKQDSESLVKGFGDLAAGQKSGKLDTSWQPGTFYNVEDYDHLTLYCYLKKFLSGSSDSVQVRVERRPLRSVGFATDQAVEYETSGSYVEAKYKDLLHTKEIDYGDLSMSEIGWPIDIPLENVKEVRVSCKHKNGQSSDENQNLIVWGRLIKSEQET